MADRTEPTSEFQARLIALEGRVRRTQMVNGILVFVFLTTVPALLITVLQAHHLDHSVTVPFHVNFANGKTALAVDTIPPTSNRNGIGVNLKLYDPDGQSGIDLASEVRKNNERHHTITLYDLQGKPTMEMDGSRNGPAIQLYYPSGKKSFEISQDSTGTDLMILGPDNSGALDLRYLNFPSNGGGEGGLTFYNQRGDRTVDIGGGDMIQGGVVDVFERNPRSRKGRWISLESLKGENRLAFHPDDTDRAELELKSSKTGSNISIPDKSGKPTFHIP